MEKEFFISNRKKLYKKMKDNSVALLFSGKAPKKLGDENYAFTPLRNFYYMTGLDRQNMTVVLYKKGNICETTVFIERYDEVKAKWVGAVMLPDEVTEISGISNTAYLDEFDEIFASLMFNKRIENVYMDFENRDFVAVGDAFNLSDRISKNYPYIKFINVHDIIAELRMIKEKCEIEKIEKAIDMTKKGIYAMMSNSRAGMMEYEIEAYFDFELKRNGVRDFAFKSIAASGKNGTVLHYSDNNRKTRDNDLILFDVGAQWEYYNGDITRTFPVNGKFTQRQKEIYNIVLEGQGKVIDAIKPGLEFKRLNEILKEYYAVELKKIGLINSDDEVSKYYYHGVSHMLGLETHDVGRHNEGLLEEGMVFTVEPGLYIAEEEIGIRIEDNIVVTNDGCRVLSKDIIRTVDEIESFMAGNK
ncbi:MAG: aminopeptidase P family protein [Clostridia bacterium]|nr:aminopeptidase P family protein [Clostridia bacterium]